MTMVSRKPTIMLSHIHALGFDESVREPFNSSIKVRCSCCSAAVINGTPCHERGCPNQVNECQGCNALVPRNVRYCEDCS